MSRASKILLSIIKKKKKTDLKGKSRNSSERINLDLEKKTRNTRNDFGTDPNPREMTGRKPIDIRDIYRFGTNF